MKYLFLLPSLFVLCQCGHVVQKTQGYVPARQVQVNGALLTSEMITTDGHAKYSFSAMVYFVAGEVNTGPYKCLFTAWGKEGLHRDITVHRLGIRTASGRTIAMAEQGLGKRIAFAPGTEPGLWQATYLVPNLINVDYKEAGDLFIDTDITVRTRRGAQRRRTTVQLTPSTDKEVDFASIFNAFKKEEHDDQMPR